MFDDDRPTQFDWPNPAGPIEAQPADEHDAADATTTAIIDGPPPAPAGPEWLEKLAALVGSAKGVRVVEVIPAEGGAP